VGENIRKDLAEDQIGIPIHVDIQIINSATCEPVVGAFVDIWSKTFPILPFPFALFSVNFAFPVAFRFVASADVEWTQSRLQLDRRV
jgi:hypothetical protein